MHSVAIKKICGVSPQSLAVAELSDLLSKPMGRAALRAFAIMSVAAW